MKDLIKVYRWENREILEKEVVKSDLKHITGWRTEPDEAMLFQLQNKRYVLENEIFKIKTRINDILNLQKDINNLKTPVPELLEKNHFGLSKESIKELVSKLNELLEVNYEE